MSDIPQSTIIQTHSPEKRRDILLRLKDAARKLTPFAHQQSLSGSITNAISASLNAGHIQRLDEHVAEAYELCSLIEICLFHGIRIKEFHGVIPFWGLLERLETQQASRNQNSSASGQVFRQSIRSVASMPTLRTPVAKARGWIREALNLRVLDEFLLFILHESRLVELFYTPESILRKPDNIVVLMAVLRTLKVLPFFVTVEDNSLNFTPSWVLAMIATATAGNIARPIAPSSGSESLAMAGNAPLSLSRLKVQPKGIFSSFMSSMERGISGVLESVDSLASRVEKETSFGDALSSLKGIRKPTPLFGSPLRDLLLDSMRCGVSHMDPRLGIPSMVLAMLAHISAHVDTPELFRQSVDRDSVKELRWSLEHERGIPTSLGRDSNPEHLTHSVAWVLLQWLSELPEPLIGFEHYGAIAACQEMEDEKSRVRNLSLLIQETPWYCQPVLSKVLSLLSACVSEEHATKNGLDMIAVAVLSTPFLYRPIPSPGNRGTHSPSAGLELDSFENTDNDDEIRAQMAAAAAGTTLVEFLIAKEEQILAPLRGSLTHIRTALSSKVSRLRSLTDEIGVGLSHGGKSQEERDEQLYPLALALWDALGPIQETRRIRLLEGSVEAINDDGETEILSSSPNSNDSTDYNRSVDMHEYEKKSSYLRYGGASAVSTGFNAGSASTSTIKESVAPPTLEALLSDGRWDVCGFPSGAPLREFQSNGLLALKCLIEFLLRYQEQGCQLGVEFAQKRARHCTLSQVALQMSKFTADALRLTPTPSTPVSAPIQHLAKQPSWTILTELNCFQELFNLAMWTFDEAWRGVTDERGTLPHVDTYQQCLLYVREALETIIKQRPRTLEVMWESWSILMAERRRLILIKEKDSSSRIALRHPPVTHANPHVSIDSGGDQRSNRHMSDDTLVTGGCCPMPGEKVLHKVFPPLGSDTPVGKEMAKGLVGKGVTPLIASVTTEPAMQACQAMHFERRDSDDTVSEKEVSQPLRAVLFEQESHPATITHSHHGVPLPVEPSKRSFGSEGDVGEGHLDSEERSAVLALPRDDEGVGEQRARAYTQEEEKRDASVVWVKSLCGIETRVLGGSHILNSAHIDQLESALPVTHQCLDWRLLYRLSRDGASLNTLLLKSGGFEGCLLVLKDLKGAVFGGLITEKLQGGSLKLKKKGARAAGGGGHHVLGGDLLSGTEKYYGNGTVGVWTFVKGALQYFPAGGANPYYILSSPNSFAMGGGENFALYLDGDLNKGSSGPCQTFLSPCLASEDQFTCSDCELYGMQSPCP